VLFALSFAEDKPADTLFATVELIEDALSFKLSAVSAVLVTAFFTV
jgi:hypothetical protein